MSSPNYYDTLADLELADAVGTLELADFVGAPRRRRRRRPMRRRGVAARSLIPRTPGVPNPGARIQPLGIGSGAFTAASGTLLQVQTFPQRPFKGQRLVVALTRTGTTATGLVTLTQLNVGTNNQLVGTGPIVVDAFGAGAFDVNMQLDPSTPGVMITAQFNISAAPTGSDRVDFGAVLFGTTIG